MTFREMLVEDLDQVVDIEQNLFSVPWTKEGFLTYLMKKDTNVFCGGRKRTYSWLLQYDDCAG